MRAHVLNPNASSGRAVPVRVQLGLLQAAASGANTGGADIGASIVREAVDLFSDAMQDLDFDSSASGGAGVGFGFTVYKSGFPIFTFGAGGGGGYGPAGGGFGGGAGGQPLTGSVRAMCSCCCRRCQSIWLSSLLLRWW
jgi:hypothetical protein